MEKQEGLFAKLRILGSKLEKARSRGREKEIGKLEMEIYYTLKGKNEILSSEAERIFSEKALRNNL